MINSNTMDVMDINTLNDFLDYTASQKEVSLMVAQDSDEQNSFKNELENYGFQEAKSMTELLDMIQKPVKLFIVLHTNFTKHLYDLMVQYPTGQVELSHLHKLDTRVVSPCYEGSSVIFLTTKQQTAKYLRDGFDIKAHAGLTYQS